METDEKIQYAIENTEVLRPPRQHLATFGTTNIYYYMITELMHEVNVIREGRVIAAKPRIITPAYLINIEGFSGPARRYIQMLAEKNPHEPGVFYSYKNEPKEMNIISQPLPELVDKIYQRIDNQSDPLSTVIKGVEEMWDVSLLKFTFELTRNSVYSNVSEFYGRGLFNVDERGVPRAARESIEELFEITSKDPSKAPELISELRQWNVWAEYQDRFLQLFRKT
ncbi:MAG: hypothetical protein NT082_02855 [Chloroflexi bacterium]|nr:hypothetical protein [Chloroflexota bacterium]